MKSKNPVKMLTAFAVVLLVFGVTEGRIMNKCELKAKLDTAELQQITIMEETITVNSLIARLVCKASISAFNTSFIKNITVHNKEMKPAQAPPQAPPSGAPPQASPRRGPPQDPSSRVPPKAPTSGAPPKAAQVGPPPKTPPAETPPKPNAQAPAEELEGSGHEMQHSQLTKVVGHLYGVFQLSDQLACDSGMIPSLNVCNMTCSALTDDDITNDIACLKTLMNFMKTKPKEIQFDFKKIVEMMLVKECHSVVPPNYFADCV